jgi:hypothetical protein
MTEGVFSALTADAAPATLRGTAFGVVNLVRGLMLVAASVAGRRAVERARPRATFLAGAALAGLAALPPSPQKIGSAPYSASRCVRS